jgi:putative tryptophan/tyrosine transport system substrate-binding protein
MLVVSHKMRRRTFIKAIAGSAIALPLAVRAQQRVPVVGFLSTASPGGYATQLEALRQGLREEGYREGQNLVIEYRFAEDHPDRYEDLAIDLAKRNVDVIVVGGGTSLAIAAKAASSTIPIVFIVGGDPVRAGLVASLNRPGGNVSGIAQFSELLITKRLEVANELTPTTTTIGAVLNPANANVRFREADLQAGASTLGRKVRILYAASAQQFDAVFTSAADERLGAVVVQDDTLFTNNAERLVKAANGHVMPAIYHLRQFVDVGGLMSYGPHIVDSYRQLGLYAGRVLKGEKPANLPILQPTKFEFIINLKTAKALGADIPPLLLARADELVE